MSANRAVQAAQRRRSGPPEPSMPGRSPQPSINSAQMFANQARPGQGPSMPTGRLAGQQAQMQQQQMQQGQQQMQQQQGQQQNDSVGGFSKISIPQAITLITLRLGAVESKLIALDEMPHSSSSVDFEGHENMSLIDNSVIQSITSRLESLEKRSGSSVSGSTSGPEINLLKQQFEALKQAVIQTKNSSVSIVKDNKDLKMQVDNLKKELSETKELLNALQNMTMDNSQKIMDFSMGNITMDNEIYNESLDQEVDYDSLANQTMFTDISELNGYSEDNDFEQNEIIGTNLKEMIESEINANL